MTGYLHLMPISKSWVISYQSNHFTTTLLPIIINLDLYKKDDNKKVEFEIINVDGKDYCKIRKLGRNNIQW